MPTRSNSLSPLDFLAKVQPLDLALAARLAQDLNLRKAADKLDHMAESIASRRLKRIETLLGTRLFERSTRSMSMSMDGERLVQQIDQVLAALNDLRLLSEDLSGEVTGLLNVGVGPPMAEVLTKQFVPDFLARYPNIQLRLHAVTRPDIDSALAEMDLVIHLTLPSSEAVGVRRLGKLQTGFYASADYLKEHGTPEHPSELAAHRLLLASGALLDVANIPWVDADGHLQFLELPNVHSCDTMSAVLSLACRKAGITLIPNYLNDFLSGELSLLFDGRFGPSFDIYGFYPSARLMPKRVAVFLDELLTAVKSDPRFQ